MSEFISILEKACADVLHCPHCQGRFQTLGPEVVCDNRHVFQFTFPGYLNMFHEPINNDCSEHFFTLNKTLVDEGCFASLEAVLVKTILSITNHKKNLVIIDAGCGEGTLFSGILLSLRWEGINVKAIGMDRSMEAITHAVTQEQKATWIVAGPTRLPVQNGSVDVILNTMCAANYDEFNRVLKPGGWLLKTVSGSPGTAEESTSMQDEAGSLEHIRKTFAGHMFLRYAKRVHSTRQIRDSRAIRNFPQSGYAPKAEKATDQDTINFTLFVGQKA